MSSSFRAVAVAAALACTGASAFAQSTVSIYGLMDGSVGSYKTPGGVRNKAVASGDMTTSFVGFKGSEDLGGGVSAVFMLEHFMRPDVGAAGRFDGDAFWARSAYVGLKGAFGSTTLGRNTTPFFVSTLVFNPFGDSFTFSPSILHYFQVGGALRGDSGWSNSIAYKSNNYDGLSVNLLANTGESAPTSKGNNLGGNVMYFKGDFAGTVAWQSVKNGSGGLPAGVDKQEAFQVGATYDFKVAKLFGQAGQVKDKGTAALKSNIYLLGATAPLGNGRVQLAYGHVEREATGVDVTRKTTTIGYDYNLSKRTDVYIAAMSDKVTGLEDGSSYAAGIRLTY